MIRVVIADDQDIYKQGLKLLLSAEKDIEVCGLADQGEEAYQLCMKYKVDVVLMDIRMPIMNGVEATRRIKRDFPQIKVIILTTFNEDSYIFESLRYGASGYLLKDAPVESMIQAIRIVYQGGVLMQPEVAVKVVNKFATLTELNATSVDPRLECLTERERDICHYLGEGYNNQEIASCLYLSVGTVKNHITNILKKLNLRDRTQLAIFAVKNHL